MITTIPATTPAPPQKGRPAMKAHAAQPNDNDVSSVTKIRWKAFSDTLFQWIAVPVGKSLIAHRVKPIRPTKNPAVQVNTV